MLAGLTTATNQRSVFHSNVSIMIMTGRQDLGDLVRPDAEGDRHRAGAGAPGPVEQVRPLREGRLRAAHAAAAPRREHPPG